MARLKIDLLPKEAEEIKKINLAIKWLKMVNEVMVGVFILAVVIIFGLYFWSNYQLKEVDKKVKLVTNQIEQSSVIEQKYRWYQEVLGKADKVISGRKDYRGIFNDLFVLIPAEVMVTGVSFDKEVVIFEGKVDGVQKLALFLDKMKSIEKGESKRFDVVALTKVVRTGDAYYTFNLELGSK